MKTTEIHATFSQSSYGRELEQNIRFGDFKPDYIPNSLWENLLGDDVNNLRHMPHTLELAKNFQKYHKLGGELLRLTAISHDWGEAMVGDVALPDKEAAGVDDAEIAAYRQIAAELVPQVDLSQVPEVIWGEHELSEPFNVIEYIGYCRTGLRAGRMASLLAGGVIRPNIPRKCSDGLVGGLLALNKMVELKNFRKLSAHQEKYPYIGELMR